MGQAASSSARLPPRHRKAQAAFVRRADAMAARFDEAVQPRGSSVRDPAQLAVRLEARCSEAWPVRRTQLQPTPFRLFLCTRRGLGAGDAATVMRDDRQVQSRSLPLCSSSL